jgi:hypothetical protein
VASVQATVQHTAAITIENTHLEASKFFIGVL